MQFISMTSPNVSALIICVHLNHFCVKNPDLKVFQIWVVSLSSLRDYYCAFVSLR